MEESLTNLLNIGGIVLVMISLFTYRKIKLDMKTKIENEEKRVLHKSRFPHSVTSKQLAA